MFSGMDVPIDFKILPAVFVIALARKYFQINDSSESDMNLSLMIDVITTTRRIRTRFLPSSSGERKFMEAGIDVSKKHRITDTTIMVIISFEIQLTFIFSLLDLMSRIITQKDYFATIETSFPFGIITFRTLLSPMCR